MARKGREEDETCRMGKINTWYKRINTVQTAGSGITSLANDKVGVKPFGISGRRWKSESKEWKRKEEVRSGRKLSDHRTQDSAEPVEFPRVTVIGLQQ